MRSPIRALLVAVVAMLGMILVAPGIAEAKSKTARTVKSTHSTRTTRTTKSTKSSKRVVKHPWSKGHAKAQPRPHRVRTSPAAKRHPAKG